MESIRRPRCVSVILILMALGASSATLGQVSQPIDLYFYGDTRQGAAQRPAKRDFHARIIKALVTQHPRTSSGSRAIIFLGDAVSIGGSRWLFEKDFLSVVNAKGLCPAFCTDNALLQFYPVIGDHETYYLPKTAAVAADIWKHPPSYETHPQSPIDSVPDRTSGPAVGAAVLGFDGNCPALLRRYCKDPKLPEREGECARCRYQEEVRHGNLATFVFDQLYSSRDGFAPLHEALAATSSQGATWYSLSFPAPTQSNAARRLVVIALDTQVDSRTGISQIDPVTYKALTQQEWLRHTVGALEPGTLLLIVGHRPPGISCHDQQLYFIALDEAIRHGVKVIGLVASHIHDFGFGMFDVLLAGAEATKQRVLAVISGDAGAHDGESFGIVSPARPIDFIRRAGGCRSWPTPRLAVRSAGDWFAKTSGKGKERRRGLFDSAWVGHLRIEGEQIVFNQLVVGSSGGREPREVVLIK